MVDSEKIALMERVENGEISLCFILNFGFMGGEKGYPKNHRMALYYIDKLKMSLDFKESYKIQFLTYCQEADTERIFGNYENAKIAYTNALKILANNIQFSEWDFAFLKQISGLEWLHNLDTETS